MFEQIRWNSLSWLNIVKSLLVPLHHLVIELRVALASWWWLSCKAMVWHSLLLVMRSAMKLETQTVDTWPQSKVTWTEIATLLACESNSQTDRHIKQYYSILCKAKSRRSAMRTCGLILVYTQSRHRSPWALHSAVNPDSRCALIFSKHSLRRSLGSCLTVVVFRLINRSSSGLPPSSKKCDCAGARPLAAVCGPGTTAAASDEALLGGRWWPLCWGVATIWGCRGSGIVPSSWSAPASWKHVPTTTVTSKVTWCVVKLQNIVTDL